MADSPPPVARLQAGTDAPGRKGRREKQTQPLTPDVKKAVGPQSGGFFRAHRDLPRVNGTDWLVYRFPLPCGHILWAYMLMENSACPDALHAHGHDHSAFRALPLETRGCGRQKPVCSHSGARIFRKIPA